MENLVSQSGLKSSSSSAFWRNRKVFVTGATGIVGAWLVKDLLAAGATVVALVRDTDPQSEFYRSGSYLQTFVVNGKLEDFTALERAINEHEIDTVFHLAAQPIVSVAQRNPLPTFEANIRGTYNLLEACRVHHDLVRQVVIASSDKAYGDRLDLPYVEEMPVQGRQPYEVSKSCADLLAQSYYHTYALPVAIARCGNIFGGGDLNWSRIVPGTIRSCLHGERPVIRSNGQFIRDYIYVKDVVRAYLRLAEAIENPLVVGQAFNFSPQRPLKVLEIVEEIQRLMDCESLLVDIRDAAQGEIPSQYLSAEKAGSILGWEPAFSLADGLSETIQWYREFFRSREGSQ